MNVLPSPRPRRVSAASLARCLLAAAGMLAASACSVLGSAQRDPVTIYAPSVHVAPDPSWPRVGWQLALLPATSAPVIDTSRIAVRPTPDELQVYHGAAWTQPPPGLVEDAVLRTLEDSGRIGAVARLETGLRADFKLALDVRRFEADYAGQPLPTATVEVSAKLLDARDQRVVASHVFLHTQAASGTALPAVATAFGQALDALAGDIAGWTLVSGQTDARTRLRP